MRPKIPIDLITDDGDEEIRTSLLASIKSMEIRSTTGPAAVESKYYHEAGYGCLLSFQLHPSLSTKVKYLLPICIYFFLYTVCIIFIISIFMII